MSNLNDYINSLNDLSNNIDKIIKDVVIKDKGILLSNIKLRLFNKGLDANLKSLGTYSKRTVLKKKKKNQRTSHVTLRDTGDWYNSMFIDFKNNEIIVDSSDFKTGILTDIYGDAILGLTEQELNNFIDANIEKALNKRLNEINYLKNIDSKMIINIFLTITLTLTKILHIHQFGLNYY